LRRVRWRSSDILNFKLCFVLSLRRIHQQMLVSWKTFSGKWYFIVRLWNGDYLSSWSLKSEFIGGVYHHICRQRWDYIKSLMNWYCNLMLKILVTWLCTSHSNKSFSRSFSFDHNDIAFRPLFLNVLPLIQWQNQMRILQWYFGQHSAVLDQLPLEFKSFKRRKHVFLLIISKDIKVLNLIYIDHSGLCNYLYPWNRPYSNWNSN
jgi:hypothetical protein